MTSTPVPPPLPDERDDVRLSPGALLPRRDPILEFVILFFTGGIYGIYWVVRLGGEVNQMCEKRVLTPALKWSFLATVVLYLVLFVGIVVFWVAALMDMTASVSTGPGGAASGPSSAAVANTMSHMIMLMLFANIVGLMYMALLLLMAGAYAHTR